MLGKISDQHFQKMVRNQKSPKCSQWSQEAPRPSQNLLKKKIGPRALWALFGPTGPKGPYKTPDEPAVLAC